MSAPMFAILYNLAGCSEALIPDVIRFACAQYIESAIDLTIE
jgi:hypothetical protein